MKTMAVGEVKILFSQILGKVKQRKIGILDGKVKIEFKNNFKMTTEELYDLSNQKK